MVSTDSERRNERVGRVKREGNKKGREEEEGKETRKWGRVRRERKHASYFEITCRHQSFLCTLTDHKHTWSVGMSTFYYNMTTTYCNLLLDASYVQPAYTCTRC